MDNLSNPPSLQKDLCGNAFLETRCQRRIPKQSARRESSPVVGSHKHLNGMQDYSKLQDGLWLAFKTSQGISCPRTLLGYCTLLCVKYGLRRLPGLKDGSSFFCLKFPLVRGHETILAKTVQVFKLNTSWRLESHEINTAPSLERAYLPGNT